jgi:V8-like Glu-specific endopeptidase
MNMSKRIKWLALSLIFVVLLLSTGACGPAATPAPPAPAATEAAPAMTEAPATEAAATEAPSVFYGEDNRLEPFDDHVPNLARDLTQYVAVLVRPSTIATSGTRAYLNSPTLDEKYGPLCPNQQFADQIAPGFCTGFLIGPDTLVTAGHCIKDNLDCQNTRFVFGFQMNKGEKLDSLATKNVYRCKQVVTSVREPEGADYAVIRLDRSTGLKGFDYAVEDETRMNQSVFVIGHPNGLPMKIATDVYVLDEGVNLPYFVVNSDTFGGNSGSPVVSTSDPPRVLGILVRGETDYEINPLSTPACIQVKTCQGDASDCRGEQATKISVVHQALSTPSETNTSQP